MQKPQIYFRDPFVTWPPKTSRLEKEKQQIKSEFDDLKASVEHLAKDKVIIGSNQIEPKLPHAPNCMTQKVCSSSTSSSFSDPIYI